MVQNQQSLHVWSVSGQELATISPAQIEKLSRDGQAVLALKRHLHGLCGVPRFRQRLLHQGSVLEDHSPLDMEDLQLLQLPFVSFPAAPDRVSFKAQLQGDLEQVEELLGLPADPNSDISDCGWCPLHWLARHPKADSKLKVAELLLEAGADKDGVTGGIIRAFHHPAHLTHVTPLMEAARKNHPEMVRLLVQAKADMEKVCGYRHTIQFATALWLASHLGHLSVARLLLQAGAKDSQFHPGRGTSLHVAVKNGHMEIVQMLLHYGFNTSRIGNLGTPLHEASLKGNLHMVETLLEAKAETNQICRLRRSSFFRTDVLLQDSAPLHVVSLLGHDHLVDLLLAARADVEKLSAKDTRDIYTASDLMTPLHLASVGGHPIVLQRLLEARADVNQVGSLGTALRVSCLQGRRHVTSLLLKAAADPNVSETKEETKRKRDFDGLNDDPSKSDEESFIENKSSASESAVRLTPLHAASMCGQVEIVRLLLHAGARKDGALEVAQRYGQTAVALEISEDLRSPAPEK